jgi:hypothetical protein
MAYCLKHNCAGIVGCNDKNFGGGEVQVWFVFSS